MKIKIGTRGSKLALYQTELVVAEINKHYKNIICEIVPIITSGDKITDKNLYDIGGKALFLKEIEEQLISGDIDIAVHSLKDVPGILPPGLAIKAVLPREEANDVLVSFKAKSIAELPPGCKFGTSSSRRKVLVQKIRTDINIIGLRGNVQTRLEKIKNGELDAIILAYAGLKRLGLYNPDYCHILDINEMLPAAGQGTIGIEALDNNQKMTELCKKINHLPSWHISLAERGFLSYLNADCRTPVSAYAKLENNRITAHYMLSDFDGNSIRFHSESGSVDSAKEIGVKAAKSIL